MPLTAKGKKIKAAMQSQYGAKKGESVFYASINKGNVKGAEKGGKIRSGEERNERAVSRRAEMIEERNERGGKVRSGATVLEARGGDNAEGFHNKGAPPGGSHPMHHAKSMGGGRW